MMRVLRTLVMLTSATLLSAAPVGVAVAQDHAPEPATWTTEVLRRRSFDRCTTLRSPTTASTTIGVRLTAHGWRRL